MVVINFFCLGFILPINWTGSGLTESVDHEKDLLTYEAFYKTTIRNVPTASNWYWVHIISAICISIVCSYLLRSYRASTITKNDVLVSRRTLLIGKLSQNLRSKQRLQAMFKEAFPRCHIEAIQFVYDTTKLETLRQNLESVIVAREYCDLYKKKYKKSFMVHPTGVNENAVCSGYCRVCSWFLVCLRYWPCEQKIDGSVYYSDRELAYRRDIQNECRRLVKSPHDAAFVTLRTHKQARRVYNSIKLNFNANADGKKSNSHRSMSSERKERDLKSSSAHKEEDSVIVDKTGKKKKAKSKEKSKSSSYSDKRQQNISLEKSGKTLDVAIVSAKVAEKFKQITVRYAPHPDNVEYQTLVLNYAAGFLTQLSLNLLIFVIFLFLSTPTVLFTYLVQLKADRVIRGEITSTFLDSPLANYGLVLIQILAAVILPTMIMLISQNIPYEDSATKNHAILWKVFLFLMLMVIVLPSFGLST